MMKKIISRSATLLITISLILPMSVFAEEVTFGQVLDDLAKAEKELKENQQSINNKENQIDENNSTIKNLKKQIEDMGKETVQLQQQIADSNIEIEERKKQTKDIIAYYQMSQGENIYLEYVFGGESITDLVYRLSVVEQITEYNDNAVKSLQDLILANESRKVELANREKEYESKIDNLNTEISKLNNAVSKLGELSPSLEEEVNTKRKLVESYRKEGCKNRSDVIGRDCAVTNVTGIFKKPIRTGYITSFVGYRWGSLHRGLDMGSSQGRNTALYSIGNGVIKSIWTDSAGAKNINVEYRARNGQYYTAIYAHLSRYADGLYVGKAVNENTILGYMGDTGMAYGVHLHLEVWPCRLYADSNCRTWNQYVSFVNKKYNEGFKGAETVISFPGRTYQTWYNR